MIKKKTLGLGNNYTQFWKNVVTDKIKWLILIVNKLVTLFQYIFHEK